MEAYEQIKRKVEADGVEFIYAMFVEMHGKPCAKLVPVEALEALMEDGAGFAGFAAGPIVGGDDVDVTIAIHIYSFFIARDIAHGIVNRWQKCTGACVNEDRAVIRSAIRYHKVYKAIRVEMRRSDGAGLGANRNTYKRRKHAAANVQMNGDIVRSDVGADDVEFVVAIDIHEHDGARCCSCGNALMRRERSIT